MSAEVLQMPELEPTVELPPITTVTITIELVNDINRYLATRPFSEVCGLIPELERQALESFATQEALQE